MAFKGLVHFVWASLLVSSSLGALYTDVKDLPKTEYDYVIVGAGTAGATVAGRLAENQNVSILVLEAGVE
jgi:ribulose 1,5-bisphosphate synthetase/thiazole synthase